MSTNNEIEFKQLLSQTEYQQIYNVYFKGIVPFSQTNYYIDTPDFQLKAHKSALRIRVKDNFNEMTLKIPATVGLMEYNCETLVEPQLNKLLLPESIPSEIIEQLKQMDISLNELTILGALTTNRVEKEISNNLLVLDHSSYLDKEDYELEYEVTDHDQGLQSFKALLEQFNIEHQTPDNKVQRFFSRKAKLNEQ
ncbi:CYTH domain-containing protein [Staphylococcus gallinarum]|uniref:CYTH domain-containing protein n=1 Tax=Staphylococcus gallinarum TaxID=1293 RepID=A0A3A0VS77_STAGA|nr:CYTH domain-containing protein [Staphylococcus gallinarum]RIP35749.1 CYTH domain-containing protein [Staphylococcus gallinarum]